jgi:hypothetical protein
LRDCPQTRVRLDALDAQLVAQMHEMEPGATRHVEQACGIVDPFPDEAQQGRHLVGVRLAPRRVHDVVDRGAALVRTRVVLL